MARPPNPVVRATIERALAAGETNLAAIGRLAGVSRQYVHWVLRATPAQRAHHRARNRAFMQRPERKRRRAMLDRRRYQARRRAQLLRELATLLVALARHPQTSAEGRA